MPLDVKSRAPPPAYPKTQIHPKSPYSHRKMETEVFPRNQNLSTMVFEQHRDYFEHTKVSEKIEKKTPADLNSIQQTAGNDKHVIL